ncbi:monovalent cation/H(+) antiporter subunit G [Ensifer soli]|uniref:monovalent cation/H(+) antiporter subunit G n=1 Tax=Ciceribacter sp. sgz301302 TaxID=3342379 RepID=UPI0035BA1E83
MASTSILTWILSGAVALLTIGGAVFTLLAAIGILRFPDLYTRMHAASKAGTVGSGLLLLAAGLNAADPAVLMRALLGFVFFILTAPVAAHLLARAAHAAGQKQYGLSAVDEMKRASKAEKAKH